ncbi:MAG: histidine phosphatase family protein [Clostridia bacterium]|nr:histidine phosphatase family protein [Clostridia bacterium]
MNNKTKIIIVRHGQSLGNATRTILGHTDLDLSEHGYKQANSTAIFLKNEQIDLIYSSDLIRAFNTAVPHAKLRNMDIISSINLREIYVGEWEGMKIEDIISKWGREVYENDWFGHFGTFRFPGGESIKEGGERFYKEVYKIAKDNQGKTILITAHAAVIRAFWAIISDIPWEKVAEILPFASNASFSVAFFENDTLLPDTYSYDEHLAEVGITKVKLV